MKKMSSYLSFITSQPVYGVNALDANLFSVTTHDSLTGFYSMGPYSHFECQNSKYPVFSYLGQRSACCGDYSENNQSQWIGPDKFGAYYCGKRSNLSS